MQYCPNCSAYQYDTDAERCRKCGFDLTAHRAKVATGNVKDETPAQKSEANFDPRVPCRLCGSPTKKFEGDHEALVEGNRISIRGLKLMGGDITKRTVTQITYTLSGYECQEGHRLYRSVSCRVRLLCPMCYHPMMKYGSALISCPNCNKHFPVNEWPDPDPMDVLHDEGWQPLSE
ncbi:MAG: hypothetical protein JW939_07780 [Candidatus Thermoplasmatota archaeon]|nr:hypothetical protein [Candidatus Thermoplasmatota archaeon]